MLQSTKATPQNTHSAHYMTWHEIHHVSADMYRNLNPSTYILLSYAHTQLLDIDSFTGRDPLGSCIVPYVCTHNAENSINNCQLGLEEAHYRTVLLLKQCGLVLLTS
jgi:hypothetical protein